MVHGSRWQARTTATIAIAGALSGCAQLELVLGRFSGGVEGSTRATTAVQAGLGRPAEGVFAAYPADAPIEPPVARYLALSVQAEDSQLGFTMDAPLEQIRGRISDVSGKLMINPEALSEMTGVFTADLSSLQLHQRTRASEQTTFAAEVMNAQQNEQARHWLQIGADVPQLERAANGKVEFRPTEIAVDGAQTLGALTREGTSATLHVRGNLTVHSVTKPIVAALVLTADIVDGQLNGLHFKSTTPVALDLETFAISPREGWGKVAQKTLAALAPKVATRALVSITATARPHSR